MWLGASQLRNKYAGRAQARCQRRRWFRDERLFRLDRLRAVRAEMDLRPGNRSCPHQHVGQVQIHSDSQIGCGCALIDRLLRIVGTRRPRSEEHTSELQSLAYLVCRLLLEKKKERAVYPRGCSRRVEEHTGAHAGVLR